jgi:EAL domain-containing protein (putative c-di-GMP-specific phosphodiesterase class I)
MGIAYSEGGLVPPDRLVRNADTAMYQAKSRGKNKFVLFEESMDILSNDQIELERALQTALQQHEFFLEYQPIYDLKHNRVVGVEALLRWAHPTRGLLAPNLFLPAAEEAGLMGQIGAWTLREACRQVKHWENRRRDLFVSVNLSAQQIQAFEIVGEAVSAFEEHHIGPERLQIEVTEKTAQSLVGNASSTLSALRRAGVRVAIDDFGTGFASNASDEVHIADALKIDVSLTQKVDTNDAVRQLVATIISSGHSHGLQVFAEGVQTEEQLKQLKALGCRYAQGYLLGKPLSAKEIEASVLPRQVA